MTLEHLLLYFLSCFGITFVIVHSTIMDKLKLRSLWQKSQFLKELTSCSFCTGFWVGVGISLTFCPNILLPFACAGATYVLERNVVLIDEKIHQITEKSHLQE